MSSATEKDEQGRSKAWPSSPEDSCELSAWAIDAKSWPVWDERGVIPVTLDGAPADTDARDAKTVVKRRDKGEGFFMAARVGRNNCGRCL